MFFSNKNHRLNDSKQKFSIRKYKLGTFSVLVGTLFYMTSISNIQAQEVKDSNISVEIKPKIDKNEEKEHKKENEINKENNLLDDHSKQEDVKDKKDNFLQFQQELEAILQEGRLIASKIQGVEKNELEITLKEIEATIQEPKLLKQEIVISYKDKIHTLKMKSEASSELESKLNKVKELKEEIGSISSSIQYTYEAQEEEILKEAEAMTASTKTVEEIDAFIAKLKQLRNKVANRMTREHSGKRDSRNGKVINGKGESEFRAITLTPIANMYEGSNVLVNENKKDVTYYNGDTIFSVIQVSGKRGAGEPIVRYQYGTNQGKEDPTPYYIKRVGIISGLEHLTGAKLRIAYKDFRTGAKREVEITSQYWNVNNPDIQMAFVGTIGNGGNVRPGTYHITLGANGTNKEATITYKFTIKSQSERNTVRDLTPTYVDDVRHLTEAEKTALIEKFKTEHPDVVNRAHHIDFDRAEVSSDGATITIYFKDGFDTKTIQTNAQNDVVAKHQSITALYGDPHDFYKNPRNLVKSKTNHEVPQTARVTWKTPFDFSQPGTKNVVVTVSYDNGVTKDVTTPYTVLDFVGKQDKSIYQNQSGELGDARSYIKLSNGTDPATDLTIRWKGGSSVDTSTQGIQRKEIEILRGNTVMKTVTIPVAIVDDIKPTITAPDSVTLTRAEGLPGNISIDAHDNARGIGLRDANPIVVENLANPLSYNPSTKRIELSGVIPNNFQRTQATIKAVDKNGNTATKTITFNVQAQTDKYNAVANPQKQTVSYMATPSAEASVSTTGLPTGTRYTWKTTPNTSSPGDKTGVVEVTYPDTSKDTVNVTVSVRKLSDEYAPTGNKIVKNQNVSVTNDDLKAAVTINNNGNSKVRSVTPVGTFTTVNAGTQTINATVTYLDGTTDPVTIPLEVKDVTAPTIQTPSDRQNWDLIALDRTLPSITVTSVDNNGGTGVKSTTVTGLPDFLVYDNATKTIKFKNGVQEVTKLPVGQNSKTYNATIQVTDNANNPSQRQVTITVKSMTTKYNATPNGQKQTVSYSATPDAGTSINKNGLPAGTRYTWATAPSTTTGPGDKAGVVTVTYPDDSTDTVNVTVNVRRLADEYVPTGTKITRKQNTAVTNDDLKAAVTISNNGNNKVKSVTPVGTISTAEFGNQTINATVTYLDDTTDSVTIPLEVRDVTKPTIQTPADRQNWDLIALDRTIPSIKVAATDNPGGSGIKSTTVTGLPDFLVYDEATKTIKFKTGVQEVTKLPEGTDVQTHNITITVTDNANNSNSSQVTITVKSMTTKYDATANSEKQTVSYGETPDAGTSVNKTNLPAGTTYTWVTTPSTTTGPGEKAGVVTVTYPDGSKDIVNVTVKVRKLSDEYNVTGTEIVVNQDASVSNDDLKAKVTAVAVKGNANGTDKISTVVPKSTISTANYGDQIISATVTFKDGTVKDVTIPLKVKDVTKPTISAPGENTNWEMTALDKTLPNMEVRAEDNANGSGIKSVSVAGLPNYLEYDKNTNSIKFKEGKQEVEKLPTGTPSKEFSLIIRAEDNAGNVSERTAKITISSMSTKNSPEPKVQTVDNGAVPEAKNSIGNVDNLPPKTTFEWKDGAPNTAVGQPGEVSGTVIVRYPDGTSEEVPVKLTVRQIYVNGTPETQLEVPEFTGGVTPPEAPTNEVPAYTDPIGSTGVDENGNLIEPPVVEAPEYSGGVNGEPETQLESPEFTGGVNPPEAPTNEVPAYADPIGSTGVDGDGNLIDPPVVEAPEFNGGVNGEPETQPEVLEFTGGVTPPEAPTNEVPEYTDPIGSTGVDENGNLIDPPVVETPEYSGGVNGELPDPTQLPKVKLITTKWIDENGNELKPADAKAPKVLGEANEAFEHGEIDGYEFVRTVVDENGEVVTHIFRKVTSTEVSQTNDKVEPKQIPDSTPVSTKESPSQPENEKITQKESQTILPNTGTANGLGIFSAAATSILLALGLMIPIKKEDEEEEEELS